MAHLNEQGKINSSDLFITCVAWFTLIYAAWSCFIEYAFRGDLDGAVLYMGMGSLFGAIFCIDMFFYSKNGDILERNLKDILA